MIDDAEFNDRSNQVARTTQEAADYLQSVYCDDPERMVLVIGRFMSRAVLTRNHNDAFYWSCVLSRVQSEPICEPVRREIVTLFRDKGASFN